jgi:hypothetical protein
VIEVSAQEKEEVEKVFLKGAFAEYLKVNRSLASRIFLDLKHDVQNLITNANADIDEKNDASFLLGRFFEVFDLLTASLQVAEEAADYHNEDISNAILVSIEMLFQAYVDIKAGSPLSEVSDRLGNYVMDLSDTFMHFITDLAKRAKDG